MLTIISQLLSMNLCSLLDQISISIIRRKRGLTREANRNRMQGRRRNETITTGRIKYRKGKKLNNNMLKRKFKVQLKRNH